jgi:hypothetical protein
MWLESESINGCLQNHTQASPLLQATGGENSDLITERRTPLAYRNAGVEFQPTNATETFS